MRVYSRSAGTGSGRLGSMIKGAARPRSSCLCSAAWVWYLQARLGRKAPAIVVLDAPVGFELNHDPVEAHLRHALHEVRLKLARVEGLAGNSRSEVDPVQGGRAEPQAAGCVARA